MGLVTAGGCGKMSFFDSDLISRSKIQRKVSNDEKNCLKKGSTHGPRACKSSALPLSYHLILQQICVCDF